MAIASEKNLAFFSIQTDTTIGCLASCGGDSALQKSISNFPIVFVIGKQTCAIATTKLCKISCACIYVVSVIRQLPFLQRIILLIIKHSEMRVILFKKVFLLKKILTFRSPSTEINCTIKITLRAFIVFVYNGMPN